MPVAVNLYLGGSSMEQSLKCKCTCPGGLCNGEFSLYEVSETAYSRTYEYKCRRCGYTFELHYPKPYVSSFSTFTLEDQDFISRNLAATREKIDRYAQGMVSAAEEFIQIFNPKG